MVNSLASSTLIPAGVQILRLADDIETEGVLSGSNSIVVRYTGSSVDIKSRNPLLYQRSLDFVIEFYCQSYLSESGHDFAVQLMAAVARVLTNQVPVGTGVSISEPFTLSSESFEGITGNSQYKYNQQWGLMIEESFPQYALDICVQRGNCDAVWPPKPVTTKMSEWDVLDPITYTIFSPANLEGTLESLKVDENGDLSFSVSGEVFLPGPDWNKYVLRPNSSGEHVAGFLMVTVLEEDGVTPYKESLYLSTGKKLPRFSIPELGLSKDIFSGNPLYAVNYKTKAISDPIQFAPRTNILYPGRLLEIKESVMLTYLDEEYLLSVKGHPLGTPWVKKSDITRIQLEDSERPGAYCYEDYR